MRLPESISQLATPFVVIQAKPFTIQRQLCRMINIPDECLRNLCTA